MQVAVTAYEDGDLGYGFIPVYNTDEILSVAPYSFALEGNVRGLEFLEGNRDRTFTVTPIVPEPSASALLCTAMAAGFLMRRNRRT